MLAGTISLQGGGSLYEHNLMWNTCLESQDHGAMNSWGRVPYITTVRNGTASSTPAFNVVRSSFMVAGGGADGGSFDNDDGEQRLQHECACGCSRTVGHTAFALSVCTPVYLQPCEMVTML